MDLFDREDERKQIDNILSNEETNRPFVVWIEGIEGAGKTQFLKYIVDKTNLFIFAFADFDCIYKCEKINMQNEFSYIANVVFKILKDYPQKFQSFLQDYFDDQNRITLLDAGCLILPQLKIFSPIKKLLETQYDTLIHSQVRVTDKLINMQLIDFFSDIIIYYINTIHPTGNHIIFCIDDMQWIDNSSLKTLNCVLRKSSRIIQGLHISILLTIHALSCLQPDEKRTYHAAYAIMEENFSDVHTVVMNNFSFNITRQLILSKKRYFLEENISKIYQITKGNPMELIQTLRFTDEEVKRILDKYTKPINTSIDNSYFSQEMIFNLYSENENYAYILNILAVLGCSIPINVILKITNEIANTIYHNIPMTLPLKNALNTLCNKGIIQESIDGFSIYQDSMKALIVEYIKENGEYVHYIHVISDVLLSESNIRFSKVKSNIYFALKLLKEADAHKGFITFVNLLNKSSEPISSEVYEIGAECFCSDIINCNITIINDIVIEKMLPVLFESGKLKIAKRVSEYIFDFRNQITENMHIQYLIYYVKILIEMGILNSSQKKATTAVSLFKELQSLNIDNNNILMQTYLLGMSVYEHLLDFNTINDLYNNANELLSHASDISAITLSKFYRNKGLIFSHRILVDDYKMAYDYSCNIPNGIDRCIMQGTTLNNLGLAYFYNGNPTEAIKQFSDSLKILHSVGCEVTRIYNNIAVCHFILGDIESAYKFISDSLSISIDGYFINTCTKTNYALILNALGKQTEAIDILDAIILEYYSNTKKCQDEVAYSAAMLNRAYIHICNNEYLDAIKLLKESCNQKYRYEHSLQKNKRQELINYCLIKEQLIPNADISIDFSGNTNDIYKKPYSLMPFAYYVI